MSGAGQTPQAGEIIWTDFDPTLGREQSGRRPALVASVTAFNAGSVLVIEAELTARMIPITTHDARTGTEAAQRINSVNHVYRRAAGGGRLARRRAALVSQHELTRQAVEQANQLSANGPSLSAETPNG